MCFGVSRPGCGQGLIEPSLPIVAWGDDVLGERVRGGSGPELARAPTAAMIRSRRQGEHQPHRRRGRTGKIPGFRRWPYPCGTAVLSRRHGVPRPRHDPPPRRSALRNVRAGVTRRGRPPPDGDVHALGVSLAGDEQSRCPLLHP